MNKERDSNKKKMLTNKVYHGDKWEEHCSNLVNSLCEFYCISVSDGLDI